VAKTIVFFQGRARPIADDRSNSSTCPRPALESPQAYEQAAQAQAQAQQAQAQVPQQASQAQAQAQTQAAQAQAYAEGLAQWEQAQQQARQAYEQADHAQEWQAFLDDCALADATEVTIPFCMGHPPLLPDGTIDMEAICGPSQRAHAARRAPEAARRGGGRGRARKKPARRGRRRRPRPRWPRWPRRRGPRERRRRGHERCRLVGQGQNPGEKDGWQRRGERKGVVFGFAAAS
jgi:hypothetical protein